MTAPQPDDSQFRFEPLSMRRSVPAGPRPAVTSKISEALQYAGSTVPNAAGSGTKWPQNRRFGLERIGTQVATLAAVQGTSLESAALINATLRLMVSNNNKYELVRLLRSLIEPTRVETGCLACSLYEDLHDRNAFIWVEEWNTKDDLERHVRSPQYRKILAAFDMSDGQPEIRFDTVVETKGMQLIEEARGASSQT